LSGNGHVLSTYTNEDRNKSKDPNEMNIKLRIVHCPETSPLNI